jgi:hypothetical protein
MSFITSQFQQLKTYKRGTIDERHIWIDGYSIIIDV